MRVLVKNSGWCNLRVVRTVHRCCVHTRASQDAKASPDARAYTDRASQDARASRDAQSDARAYTDRASRDARSDTRAHSDRALPDAQAHTDTQAYTNPRASPYIQAHTDQAHTDRAHIDRAFPNTQAHTDRANINRTFPDTQAHTDQAHSGAYSTKSNPTDYFKDNFRVNGELDSSNFYKSDTINDEAKVRAQNRKVVHIKNRILLAQHFKKQRSRIVENFTKPENIDLLFANSPSPRLSGPDENVPLASNLNYTDVDMRNSILLLARSFINSLLVELNLRWALGDSQFYSSNNFLHRQDLIASIPDESDKYAIMQMLKDFYVNTDVQPETMHDFIQGLDRSLIDQLLDVDLKSNDSFQSLEQYREDFMFYKSSRFLNYPHSDVAKSIQANVPIVFHSPYKSDAEYYEKFDAIFKQYEAEARDKYRHLNLIIQLTKALLNTHKFTPTLSIFRYLLDKFDQHSLTNFQTLVYDSLPPYKYTRVALASHELANHIKPPKTCDSLYELVEQDPLFLPTLLKYSITHNDVLAFLQLLSFFGLDEVYHQRKSVIFSPAALFLSRSSFTKKFLDAWEAGGLQRVTFTSEKPIVIPIEGIFTAIEGCIKFGAFAFIDQLFNKMIFHLIDDANCETKQVALWLGSDRQVSEQVSKTLAIAQGMTVEGYEAKVFDKRIFSLLLSASEKSGDIGRIMWLVPHLDVFLKSHMARDECKQHVEKIKLCVANDSWNTDVDFIEQDKAAPIDRALISTIYHTLTNLKVEGLVLVYDEWFDFEKSVVDFDQPVRR